MFHSQALKLANCRWLTQPTLAWRLDHSFIILLYRKLKTYLQEKQASSQQICHIDIADCPVTVT